MNLTDQISLKRDQIAARHDIAKSVMEAYNQLQDVIAKDNAELSQLLLLEQREALRCQTLQEHNASPNGRWT